MSAVYEFKGEVPKHYDETLGPMFFEPYAVEVANLVDPLKISVALELAAGTGRVTRHLRYRLAPGAKLIATDISSDMLDVAKGKLKEEDIEWQVVNAQELPFDDNSFDLVVCCFGLMFMPDKQKTYDGILRVLKPGGKFLFSTWDELEKNGPSSLYRKIVLKYLPQPVPAAYGLPFSMHNTEEIKRSLVDAGFHNLIIQKIEKPCVSESAKDVAEGLAKGGTVYRALMESNPAAVDEIVDQLEKQIIQNFGDAPMEATMSAVIAEAEKPK